ncbi:MAG: alpha-L-arabinofuranosidase [Chitinophagaceae bacterium]|nr:alpha-L-arabinofuranosidase [Chitinophagaceae bacterium]
MPDTILYGDDRPLRKSRFSYGISNDIKGLSLDNYYKLLEQTKSEGTICVNAGYARYGLSEKPVTTAAHYAANWVRYDKGRTRFWEIGNEDYGEWQAGYKIDIAKNKDGQMEIISGELYGKIFREFTDSMRQAAKEINARIYIGATIVEADDKKEIKDNWNKGFFSSAGKSADFFVIHSYYTPYEENSKAENILNSAVRVTDNMMSHLQQMCLENKVTMKPVTLTEWNIFAVRSKQQTSFINGMHTALVLGEMAKQQYGMACRWDLANAYANGDDHGLFNKGDEPGMPKWSARPAFYYLWYFQQFFGDKYMESSSADTAIVVFASSFSDGKKGMVVINKSAERKVAMLQTGKKKSGTAFVYSLTGGSDNSSFSQRIFINERGTQLPAGGPENFEEIKAWKYSFNNKLKIILPAMSVQYILID